MDYDVRDVSTHLYLFDLSNEDKELLAKFEKFASVEAWEKDKCKKLDWLANNKENINYNIFHNISCCDNFEKIGKYIDLDEQEKAYDDIFKAIPTASDDDFNDIHLDTLITLWVLKNKPIND